jgi:hypothetical protein
VLLFLLGEGAEWHSFDSMVEKGGLGEHDKWALLRAIKSLHIEGLILVSRKEELAASAAARHVHWLMTEVEPANA